MYKYTIKKFIYYPKELYYKAIRSRKIYFTEFLWNDVIHRILADQCNTTISLSRIQKDDLKIIAYVSKQTVSNIVHQAVDLYLAQQNIVDFIDEFRLLRNEDAINYPSCAILLEQKKLEQEQDKKNEKQCEEII